MQNRMRLSNNKLSKLASINFAVLLFWSLNPYIRWIIPAELALVALFISTSTITLLLNKNTKMGIGFGRSRIIILLATFCFVIYFTTPLVHSMRWGHFLFFITFLFVIPLNNMIVYMGFRFLKKVIVILSVIALVYWVLNYLKVPLPYIPYISEARGIGQGDYYRIYGPVISLYRGALPIGGGLERICCVFGEPGHYGIYIAFILAIEKFRFKKKENLFLVLIGCLTFSTAYFGLLSLGLFYRIILDRGFKQDVKKVASIFGVILISLFLFNSKNVFETAIQRVVENNKVESIADMVENRALKSTKDTFESFAKTGKLVIGNGYEDNSIQTTNWRGLIYQFGIVGLCLVAFLVLSIIRKKSYLYALLLLAMTVLVALHRVFFMYSTTIYILLFTAMCVDAVEERVKSLLRKSQIKIIKE